MSFKTLEEAILTRGAFPIENDAATIATFTATGALTLPVTNVAGLPAAAAGNLGQVRYVSNGAAGEPCLAVSTQTGESSFAWKVVVDLDAAATASAGE
jgi:hypothetical protein